MARIRWGPIRRSALSLVGLTLVLAACGGSTILPQPTAQTVANAVQRRFGFRPTDVSCPSGIPAKVGGQFQCHFSGPDGPYVAYMRIASVRGQRVIYNIQTQRIGQTIQAGPSERTVADFVFRQTHFRPKDVRCPSGVPAIVGHSYQCTFTGPDGKYTADVVIAGVVGQQVDYRISTHRTR
jgi:Domain of unknown function (DUF4333)